MSSKKQEIEKRIAQLETKIDQDMCDLYPHTFDLQQIAKAINKNNNLKPLVKNENSTKLFLKAFYTMVRIVTAKHLNRVIEDLDFEEEK